MVTILRRYWLAIVLGVAALLLVILLHPGDVPQQPAQQAEMHISGFYGGEKEQLVQDPEFQKILKDKYNIVLDAQKLGSVEMAHPQPGLIDKADFLWPSSSNVVALYDQANLPKKKSQAVFNSPIVFYSWREVTESLIKQGIVQKQGNATYIIDMPKFIRLVASSKSWSDIGVQGVTQQISVRTTNPTQSNSGLLFACLMSSVLNGGQPVDATSVQKVLPELKLFFQHLGLKEASSADLFQQYLTTGVGAKPLIAGYEAQIVSFVQQNAAYRDELVKTRTILYPQPTVWSSHPVIARTANGVKLIDALLDPELQKLAWKKHGFRPGVPGVKVNISDLNFPGLADEIKSVTDLPEPAVIDTIVSALTSSTP
ncbi:hypothetical protein BH10CYA1_BH10CYA1_53820 [soil metagenome]